MRKIFILFVSTMLIAAFIVSCSDDSTTGPVGGYTKATITHGGYDFSEAEMDTTSDWIANSNDGEIIGWPPLGDYRNDGLWFRTRIEPTRTQNFGDAVIPVINLYFRDNVTIKKEQDIFHPVLFCLISIDTE